MDQLEIVISGVGGQGNVKAAQILGSAALKAGFNVRVSDVFGIAQRGGPVLSHVRIGDVHGCMVSEHSADYILGIEPMEALRAAAAFLKPGGVAIVCTRPIYPVEVNTGKSSYPPIERIVDLVGTVAGRVITLDAIAVAVEVGVPMAANMVMLGALAGSGALPFGNDFLEKSIEENVPRAVEGNLEAFRRGLRIGRGN